MGEQHRLVAASEHADVVPSRNIEGFAATAYHHIILNEDGSPAQTPAGTTPEMVSGAAGLDVVCEFSAAAGASAKVDP
jgi:hypothetical protein